MPASSEPTRCKVKEMLIREEVEVLKGLEGGRGRAFADSQRSSADVQQKSEPIPLTSH